MSLALNYQKRNTKATFNNGAVSGNLSIAYLQAFLEQIGLPEILDNCITYEKQHNSTFNPVDIINFIDRRDCFGILPIYAHGYAP